MLGIRSVVVVVEAGRMSHPGGAAQHSYMKRSRPPLQQALRKRQRLVRHRRLIALPTDG
jgi:hypothetical protein